MQSHWSGRGLLLAWQTPTGNPRPTLNKDINSPPEKPNNALPAWENPRQAKSWERLHKESGHLSKEWAALSFEQEAQSDTRQGLPRQGATEWIPLKRQALCFSDKVDNAPTITVPGVSYVLALALFLWHRGRKLFSSQRTGGVVSVVRESGRALRRAFWTPTLSVSRGALFAELKPHLNHSTFQKQAFQNKWDYARFKFWWGLYVPPDLIAALTFAGGPSNKFSYTVISITILYLHLIHI